VHFYNFDLGPATVVSFSCLGKDGITRIADDAAELARPRTDIVGNESAV